MHREDLWEESQWVSAHGAHGGSTGRSEAIGDGPLRTVDSESSSRQARGDARRSSGRREREGCAGSGAPVLRDRWLRSTGPGIAWLGQLIDDFHHIGPDRPLPPRSACLGFPPRHVCAAERCLLLTYVTYASRPEASHLPGGEPSAHGAVVKGDLVRSHSGTRGGDTGSAAHAPGPKAALGWVNTLW